MLPEGSRITSFESAPSGDSIVANITGLSPRELEGLASEFAREYGITLNVKG